MSVDLSTQMENLGFAWTSVQLRNSDLCRGLVHEGPHQCIREFFIKLMDTGKVASKYYVMFHIIPLMLRLRKVKDIKTVPKLVAQSCFEYVKSCCFLSFLVGLLRAGLCANWNQSPNNILSFEHHLVFTGPLSAVSILFEDTSRRNEVTNYVTAKAIRSIFIVLKRTNKIRFENETCYMHIIMMALLYYVYNHMPNNLKFRNLFELVFGDQ